MKLPEFRRAEDQTYASRGTSMRGAFMSPQLRPMTVQHQAAQMNLNIKARNPEAEGKLALAKYAPTIALMKGAGELARVGIEIDQSMQTMESEAAAAEATRRLSDLTADEILYGRDVVDEATGTQRWERSEETYERARQDIINEVRAKYRFSSDRANMAFSNKVQGADYVNRQKLQENTYHQKIARGRGAYEYAQARAVDPRKKIELHKEALAGQLIDESTAMSRIGEAEQELYENTYTSRVQGDNSGVASRQVMAELATDDLAISRNINPKNAALIVKEAAERLGYIEANNAMQRLAPLRSKDAIEEEILRYQTMDIEELGVATLEQKDEVVNIIATELKTMKAQLDKGEKITYKKAVKATHEDRFRRQEEGGRGMGGIPGSESAQDTYMSENYYNQPTQDGQIIQRNPMEVFANKAAYDRISGTIIDNERVDKHAIKAFNDDIGHKDMGRSMRASVNLTKIMADPNMPWKVKEQIWKEVGSDKVDMAIGFKNGYGENILMGKSIWAGNLDREDVMKSLKAYRNSEAYDPQADIVTYLDEQGYDKDDLRPENIAAGVADYERIFERKVQTGIFGTDINSYKEAALTEWKGTWVPENHGMYGGFMGINQTEKVTLVRGRNSFFEEASKDQEIANEIIIEGLTANGQQAVLQEWQDGKAQVLPVRTSNMPQGIFALQRRVFDEDGNITDNRAILGENGAPIYVDENGRVARTKELRQNIQLAEEAEAESAKLSPFDPDTATMASMKQSFFDFFAKESQQYNNGNEMRKEVFGNAFDEVKDGFAELMSKLMHSHPDQMMEMPIEYFYGDGNGSFPDNLTPKQNDYLWHGFLEIEARKMTNANNAADEAGKSIPYPEHIFDARMAKQRTRYKMRGLNDPAERE
jgi:hypothetical protein